MRSPTDNKAFSSFLADRKILVADTSGASRASIAGLITKLGAKGSQIALVATYIQAEEEIERSRPKIVIADYNLGKRCGLDLLQRQRVYHPELKDTLFVLVTGNTSQTAVARAAEEDVDTYILKPFTAEVFKSSLFKAIANKVAPPEYVKLIEDGKEQLGLGQIDAAVKLFEEAKELDPAPSLACFYIGQAKLMKQSLNDAEGSYLTGLAYNKIHYKCLVGLYEVLMARKRYTEAYEIIKRVSQYFPANPQRLTSVLRLAILTKSYDDVERYYRTFTNIDERNEEMIKYVCAALVVCGKYYLQQNLGSRAIELFQKAAITASGRTRILREVISALTEAGMGKQADEFLKRFPPDTQNTDDYFAADLLVLDQLGTRSAIVERARELIKRGVQDLAVYEILIRRSAEAGHQDAAEQLVHEASQKWPDEKSNLEALCERNKRVTAKTRQPV